MKAIVRLLPLALLGFLAVPSPGVAQGLGPDLTRVPSEDLRDVIVNPTLVPRSASVNLLWRTRP